MATLSMQTLESDSAVAMTMPMPMTMTLTTTTTTTTTALATATSSSSNHEASAKGMAMFDIKNVLARFPATPVFDSMWNPSVLEHAYVMLGRLLRDQGENDHWEFACMLLGDDKAHAAVLDVMQNLFAMTKPWVPITDLITNDDGLFSMHEAHVKQSSLFVKSLNNSFDVDWTQLRLMLSGESMQLPASKSEFIYVQNWTIPIVLLESAQYEFQRNHSSNDSWSRRLIPFAVQVPVPTDSAVSIEKALFDELACIKDKLRGVIQALSNPWHASDASGIRSVLLADTQRSVC